LGHLTFLFFFLCLLFYHHPWGSAAQGFLKSLPLIPRKRNNSRLAVCITAISGLVYNADNTISALPMQEKKGFLRKNFGQNRHSSTEIAVFTAKSF